MGLLFVPFFLLFTLTLAQAQDPVPVPVPVDCSQTARSALINRHAEAMWEERTAEQALMDNLASARPWLTRAKARTAQRREDLRQREVACAAQVPPLEERR